MGGGAPPRGVRQHIAAAGAGGAAPAGSARSGLVSVTSRAASQSSTMKPSFSALVCGLTTTGTPPASSVPKNDATHGSELPACTTTRSPRRTPAFLAAPAKRRASSSTSAYVCGSPSTITAVLAPSRSAEVSRLSWSRRWARGRVVTSGGLSVRAAPHVDPGSDDHAVWSGGRG